VHIKLKSYKRSTRDVESLFLIFNSAHAKICCTVVQKDLNVSLSGFLTKHKPSQTGLASLEFLLWIRCKLVQQVLNFGSGF
jgi:hypothetical protein